MATETVELDTTTADAFYQGTAPVVEEGEPLATDRGWHFSLDVDTMPLGSIFQFNPEPELTGPMQIELDPSKTYVNIRVNAAQFQKMNITRQQGLTIPTVFTAALVEAIQQVRTISPDEQVISPGWVDTIRKQLSKQGIDITNDDNPFYIAQRLLGDPFHNLTKFQIPEVEEQQE